MLGSLPRALQLKLFRYALSKLDFLDHSTYDVERDFNLSLGLRNELEMKNVGLNVTKLSVILKLPPNVRVRDARVSTLHVRIPVDLHRAPVTVSISGVVIDGEVLNDISNVDQTCEINPDSPSHPPLDRPQEDTDPRDGFKIPSVIDLTSSFLQERPSEAKEVDTALRAENSMTAAGNVLEEEDSIVDSGLGTPLSFWNFVPSFFERLVDRVEIVIEDVSLRAKLSCPSELQDLETDSLTVTLSIDSIKIEGVSTINENTTNSSKSSQTIKPGMRAIRLNGIALSISGYPEIFSQESSSALFNPEDADTVTSSSTILPSSIVPASGTFVENTALEISQDIRPVSPKPTATNPDSSVARDRTTNMVNLAISNRPFFAQMQEPTQTYFRISPSPPADASQSTLFSPISSLHGSIESEEIGSGVLSRSFLRSGSDYDPSQSNPDTKASNTRDAINSLHNLQNTEPFPNETCFDNCDKESDDSLDNEPRHFDLFQEPNTKFLGVTATQPSQENTSRQANSCSPNPNPFNREYSHIAEPVPRSAPSMTISQTLSNLELNDATREPIDDFTYYQEAVDPIEYSNPDLLYLSQSIQSSASLTSNNEGQIQANPGTPEFGDTSVSVCASPMEPRIVYASSEAGEVSETGSVYESYPPSEADETPNFIGGDPPFGPSTQQDIPIINSLSAESATKLEPPFAESPAQKSLEPNLETQAQAQVQVHIRSDADHQKIPRDTAILIQSQIMSSPSDSLPVPKLHSEETEFQSRLTEESGSEGSESVLAESMIFTHEEAGSLYMSALGASQPFGPSLPTLIEQNETTRSTPSPDTKTPKVQIRKHILQIDYVYIFIPGIASSTGNSSENWEPEITLTHSAMSDSAYPTMPGAFSVYAASRPERKKVNDSLTASHLNRIKSKPNVSFNLMEDKDSGHPRGHPVQHPPHQTRARALANRMELEIGNINVSIDLIVGKKIAAIVNTVGFFEESDDASGSQSAAKPDGTSKASSLDIFLSVASFNIHLVDRMPEWTAASEKLGIYSPDFLIQKTSSNKADDYKTLDILAISLGKLTLKHRINDTVGTPDSSSEITLKSCLVKVGTEDVMKFIPTQKRAGKEKLGAAEAAFVLHIQDSQEERRISVQTSVINFFFPVQDLEATVGCFGGLESMFNAAPASSFSSKEHNLRRTDPFHNPEARTDSRVEKRTFLTANIKGINIEVFVSSVAGGVGLSTSPIKITTNDRGGLAAKLSELSIFGPNIGGSDGFGLESQVLRAAAIDVTFDGLPTEEDLERLLKMIMPSTDSYDDGDDNVMVDILLRQRRRGSVLRINIGLTIGNLPDLNCISRFKAVTEELAKMATVAKYIPQDERPGMLTLLSIDEASFTLFREEEPQSFAAKFNNMDICHVATPSLFALSVGRVGLTRQAKGDSEVWVGESLPNYLALSNHKHKTQSMLKVRMIGDEPEPEVKIKIWNTRFEYHVESVLELLSLTPKDPPDVVATTMVNSIANLTNNESVSQSTVQDVSGKKPLSSSSSSLRLDIGLTGVSVALNPLNSNSKALFIVHDGNFVCELSSNQPFSASLDLLKANLVAIDDHDNLVSPQRQSLDGRKPRYRPSEELSHYISQGYVSVLTATSAKVNLKIDGNDSENETKMLINVEDVFIFIESCADSTQTIIGILNGMKPPLPESEEIKYMTQIMPVDVFANLDENAFMPVDNVFIGGQPRDLRSLEDMPEDLLDDEIPFNSQLIESYYPSSNPPNKSLPSISIPPALSQPELSNFQDQVCVIAQEPLTFDDHYIQAPSQEPQDTQEPEIKVVPRKVALKVCVRNTQLIWNLHDGYDWQKTRDTISRAVRKVEERAFRRRRRHSDLPRRLEEEEEEDDEEGDEESATYDVLFNSIYITLPLHRDPKDLSKDIQNQIKGNYDLQSETGSYTPTVTTLDSPHMPGSRNPQARRWDQKYQRSKRNAMQFELKGVDVDFTIFEPDGLETQTSLDLRINEVQVTENVRTSTWRKFLTYMREAGVRERGLPMAHIHVDTLRPIPELAATELSIKVKLLPLRLYVDQDALEFLTRFFEFKDPDSLKPEAKQEEPFIQRCEIDTVRVKLDFKPKRVDYAGLRSGRTTEFMNFFILEEADMELRHVALNGVSGFERLGKDLNDIWMPDIKQNQLGGVVAGVAPLRSLVNIGSGVRDLVKVPIMEYRKDGRLVRSIKKGTQHFVKTSGSEVARLGAKLAIGTQTFLERTEEFLVGEPGQGKQHNHLRESLAVDEDGESSAAAFSPYADQPLGVYTGLVQARQGLARNLNEAKEAIMRVPSEAAQVGSAKGAAAAVFRAAPTAVIRPMIGVTEAVHKTLHGIDNTIDREKREKIRDKYKRSS